MNIPVPFKEIYMCSTSPHTYIRMVSTNPASELLPQPVPLPAQPIQVVELLKTDMKIVKFFT
jgi:hypothetical protein